MTAQYTSDPAAANIPVCSVTPVRAGLFACWMMNQAQRAPAVCPHSLPEVYARCRLTVRGRAVGACHGMGDPSHDQAARAVSRPVLFRTAHGRRVEQVRDNVLLAHADAIAV
jgi:hypothetical protein